MLPQPWRVLGRKPLLSAPPWLEVAREEVGLPDGRIINDYYTVGLPDYVVVVALVPDGRVVAEWHYKHGSGVVTLGFAAGYLNPGEEPLSSARRELREETGYGSERWRSLGRFVVDGNRGCGVANFFLAHDCLQVSEPQSGDLEETQVELIPFAKMLGLLRWGTPMELCTAAALGMAYMELNGHE